MARYNTLDEVLSQYKKDKERVRNSSRNLSYPQVGNRTLPSAEELRVIQSNSDFTTNEPLDYNKTVRSRGVRIDKIGAAPKSKYPTLEEMQRMSSRGEEKSYPAAGNTTIPTQEEREAVGDNQFKHDPTKNRFGLPYSTISQGVKAPESEYEDSIFTKGLKLLLPKKVEDHLGLNESDRNRRMREQIESSFENKFATEDLAKLRSEIDPETGRLKKKTAGEVLKTTPLSNYVPFLADVPDIFDAVVLANAINRLEKGQNTATDDYVLARARAESERDSTFAAKVTEGLLDLPAFGLELLATGGIYTFVKSGTQKFLKKRFTTAAEKSAYREATEKLLIKGIGATAGATVQVAPARATKITADTIVNLTPEYEYKQGEAGEFAAFISEPGEPFPLALAKAFTDQWVEVLSEKTGGGFKEINKLADPLKDKVLKLALFKAIKKTNPKVTTSSFMKLVEAAGYNGILAEIGEERVGEVMRGLLTQVGLSDDGFVMPTREQLLVELLTFSIPGVAISAANKANSVGSFKQEEQKPDLDITFAPGAFDTSVVAEQEALTQVEIPGANTGVTDNFVEQEDQPTDVTPPVVVDPVVTEAPVVTKERLDIETEKLFIKRNGSINESGSVFEPTALERIEQLGGEFNEAFSKKFPELKNTNIIVYHDAVKGVDLAVIRSDTGEVLQVFDKELRDILKGSSPTTTKKTASKAAVKAEVQKDKIKKTTRDVEVSRADRLAGARATKSFIEVSETDIELSEKQQKQQDKDETVEKARSKKAADKIVDRQLVTPVSKAKKKASSAEVKARTRTIARHESKDDIETAKHKKSPPKKSLPKKKRVKEKFNVISQSGKVQNVKIHSIGEIEGTPVLVKLWERGGGATVYEATTGSYLGTLKAGVVKEGYNYVQKDVTAEMAIAAVKKDQLDYWKTVPALKGGLKRKIAKATKVNESRFMSEAEQEAFEENKSQEASFERETRGQLRVHTRRTRSGSNQGRVSRQRPKLSRGGKLQKGALQVLTEPYQTSKKGVHSLHKIIKDEAKDAREGVKWWNYLSTPELVLNKIGLKKVTRFLRQRWDGYKAELPENLDIITAWRDRVPGKESSRRIFKFLDGQTTTLNANEKEVALEIREWLVGWADRLGLPASQRITDYITHIFDNGEKVFKFPEELAAILKVNQAGSVYSAFTQERLGAEGFREEVWPALDAYVKTSTRKVWMDPALKRLKIAAELMPKKEKKYIKEYTDRLNMRPTELDNMVDSVVKAVIGGRLGPRPVMAITRPIRKLSYSAYIGMNASSMIRNMSQGANTVASIGEAYTFIGYTQLYKAGAREELERSGVLEDSFITDRTLSSFKKKLQKADEILFAGFSEVERINRGGAYFGAKAKFLDGNLTLKQYREILGDDFTPTNYTVYNEKDAIEYAKSVVRRTQFTFGAIDTPLLLSSDIMKTVFQYNNFTLKQTEMLMNMAKDKDYVGLIRFTYTSVIFMVLIGKAFGMDWDELTPGIPGPRSLAPSTAFPRAIVSAALDFPDQYGRERDAEQKKQDILNATLSVIPMSSQMKKTYQGYKAVKAGGKFTDDDRFQFEVGVTAGQKIQAVMFGQFAGENAKKYYAVIEDYFENKDRVKKIYDENEELRATGAEEKADAVFNDLNRKDRGIYKTIKKEAAEERKQELVPTFQEIQGEVAKGNEKQAIALYDELTDEEKVSYKGLLKDKESETFEEQKETIRPVFDEIQELIEEGNEAKALAMHGTLDKRDKKAYTGLLEDKKAMAKIQTVKEMLPTYQKLRKMINAGQEEEAIALYDDFSEEDKEAYDSIKRQIQRQQNAEQGIRPRFRDGELITIPHVILAVQGYAEAAFLDFDTAWDLTMAGESIRKVEGDAIIVRRMHMDDSERVKRRQEKDNPKWKLDHRVPLQLSGTNDITNLDLIPTALHAYYTPIENFLGRLLRSGKVGHDELVATAEAFKRGELTPDEVRAKFNKFSK